MPFKGVALKRLADAQCKPGKYMRNTLHDLEDVGS